MKQFISDTMGKRMQELYKGSCAKAFKIICLGCFFAGFTLFFLLGEEFAGSNTLLDVAALCKVKDSMIDKKGFYTYILYRRSVFLILGLLFWWWRFGKYYVYTLTGACAFSMGGCMYTCLLRYSLKGLFLWCFLYFPHAFFYTGVLFCALLLCHTPFHTKKEKIRFLYQNILPAMLLLVLFGMGIYSEAYVNITLLQDFLAFF